MLLFFVLLPHKERPINPERLSNLFEIEIQQMLLDSHYPLSYPSSTGRSIDGIDYQLFSSRSSIAISLFLRCTVFLQTHTDVCVPVCVCCLLLNQASPMEQVLV